MVYYFIGIYINILKAEFKVNKDNELFLVAKKDNEIVGVVFLCSPEYKDPSYVKYIRSGVLKAIFYGGLKASIAWIKMENQAKAPCLQLKNQTWYVNSITVRKDLQGRGIGTDIMQNGIIPFVKQHGGKEIFLFTNSEINRRFYNKNGFNEFHHQEFSYNNKSIGSWSYKKDI